MTEYALPEEGRQLMLMVADYIKAYPEHYSQDAWCGTTECVAGVAAHLVGSPGNPRTMCGLYKGRHQTVAAIAEDALGLSSLAADLLFETSWIPEQGAAARLREIADATSMRDIMLMLVEDNERGDEIHRLQFEVEMAEYGYGDDDQDDYF